MMVVVIWYDVCMIFLPIIITLSPQNKYETTYEKGVNRSHNDLWKIQIVNIKLKSNKLWWYIRLKSSIVIWIKTSLNFISLT